MNQVKYEWRKSIGGYSVDKYEYKQWSFMAKFSTKRDAINYIKSKEVVAEPINNQLDLF